jgi:hypothetical protein
MAGVVGLVFGFMFLLIVRLVAPTPVVGLLTLILSAASSIAMFNYLFMPGVRGGVASLALGFALGALLHVVFFPSSVRFARG